MKKEVEEKYDMVVEVEEEYDMVVEVATSLEKLKNTSNNLTQLIDKLKDTGHEGYAADEHLPTSFSCLWDEISNVLDNVTNDTRNNITQLNNIFYNETDLVKEVKEVKEKLDVPINKVMKNKEALSVVSEQVDRLRHFCAELNGEEIKSKSDEDMKMEENSCFEYFWNTISCDIQHLIEKIEDCISTISSVCFDGEMEKKAMID